MCCFLCVVLLYVWFSLMFFVLFKCFVKFKKRKQQKNISKGGYETLKNYGCLVFPKVVFLFSLVVFSMFGFPEGFFSCLNFLENQKKQKRKRKHIQGWVWNRLKLCVCWFSLSCVLFYFVFFCIFGFLKGCLRFMKTFGKTKKNNNNKKTYPRVGLKPLKDLFCWFSLMFFVLFSLVFFCIFGFPEAFSRWSRCLGFRY